MKKDPSEADSSAQSLSIDTDCDSYREKTESRWEVGKHGMGRTQKSDSLILQIILFLSLEHQNCALPTTLKNSKPGPGILLSALYINQVTCLDNDKAE